MKDCYIFDLDGTLADCEHRLHYILREPGDGRPKNWDAFYAACGADKPIKHMIQLALDLYLGGAHIAYVTGRSDRCRADTVLWLELHGLPMRPLYMRKEGDYRPDNEVKLELVEHAKTQGYRPLMAFEDRERVVEAFHAAGVPCVKVWSGTYR